MLSSGWHQRLEMAVKFPSRVMAWWPARMLAVHSVTLVSHEIAEHVTTPVVSLHKKQ